jgi:hypothetical protein
LAAIAVCLLYIKYIYVCNSNYGLTQCWANLTLSELV